MSHYGLGDQRGMDFEERVRLQDALKNLFEIRQGMNDEDDYIETNEELE